VPTVDAFLSAYDGARGSLAPGLIGGLPTVFGLSASGVTRNGVCEKVKQKLVEAV
jgi:hypothetical protein